jgi:hypothetical protein
MYQYVSISSTVDDLRVSDHVRLEHHLIYSALLIDEFLLGWRKMQTPIYKTCVRTINNWILWIAVLTGGQNFAKNPASIDPICKR